MIVLREQSNPGPRNKCKCPSTSERLNANLMNDLENTADPILACVAWRFCLVGRRSGVAAKFAREARDNERRSREKNKSCFRPNLQVASAPISSRFLCPRPPLLLSAPNQNRHATQANPIRLRPAGFLCRQVREASGEAARDFCKLQARRTRHFEGSERRGERKIKLLPSSRLATSHPLGERRKAF